jgi:Holliday junction resolvase RusA-like endonuclease
MNWTPDQFAAKGYQLNTDGSYSPNTKKLLNTLTKHATQQTLESLSQGKETRSTRTHIRITRYSCRPLDCDNYAGGCKPIIDQLRYAKLIRDDNPETIEVEFKQVKVKTKTQERTEIEINENR